jgi:DNA-binding beta-propeller fold protein YncE
MSVFVLGCPDDSGDVGDFPPPPPPPPPEALNVAFVLTADFVGNTGSYSTVDLDTRRVTPDITPGGVHSDAIARVFNGRIYVVNRQGVDSIQIIDPEADFTTPAGAELSVGNGTNPHDIVFINATKAYVSLYASTDVLIINPTTLRIRGRINLANLTKPGDGDGQPELDHMLFHDGLVYLTLQHLDSTVRPPAKVAPGEVVILDPDTDTVVEVLVLNGENPFSDIVFSPALNRILVSSVGALEDFGDGGIEAINPNTRTVESGFRVTEAAPGGNITHFGIVSATKGFAVVFGRNFSNTLVTFNPTTGARLATIFRPSDGFLPHFAINSRGELYLAVNGETTPTPRLRIFDVDQDRQIGSVRSGNLPPVFVLFIEEEG